MWQVFAIVIGVGWLLNRQNENGVGVVSGNQPLQDRPWFASSPSYAGSDGGGQTNPLAALFGSLAQVFSGGAPLPSSGPGGATIDPGASPSPSGVSTSALLPGAPGTQTIPSPISSDVANLADPQFWWMQPAVDVAIMRDDVSEAMALAGEYGDLSPTIVEASIGMVI